MYINSSCPTTYTGPRIKTCFNYFITTQLGLSDPFCPGGCYYITLNATNIRVAGRKQYVARLTMTFALPPAHTKKK